MKPIGWGCGKMWAVRKRGRERDGESEREKERKKENEGDKKMERWHGLSTGTEMIIRDKTLIRIQNQL